MFDKDFGIKVRMSGFMY